LQLFDGEDKRAYFTNYHYKIDVTAPGSRILSTVPNNEYRKMSGTSMASPVAAAVTAFSNDRFPGKPNFVIREIVNASSDYIDYNNPYYSGMLGKGRLNALRVMTDNSFLFAIKFFRCKILVKQTVMNIFRMTR
jgi:subtilisin family serine protease